MARGVTQVAWETRAGHGAYYTHSVRRGGRVVREYVGAGLKGEIAAAENDRRRSRRNDERAAQLAERSRITTRDAEIADLCLAVDAAIEVALHGAGYHRHDRGTWRRRRCI
jgi:hypothetical protein